jgi:hypothetical protein
MERYAVYRIPEVCLDCAKVRKHSSPSQPPLRGEIRGLRDIKKLEELKAEVARRPSPEVTLPVNEKTPDQDAKESSHD